MNRLYQKTASDTLINSSAQLLLIPLTFLMLPILTKNLSINDYGLWGLIFTTCSLSLPLTSIGLGAAMSRFLPSQNMKAGLQDGFYSVLFIRVGISFVLGLAIYYFATPLAAHFFSGSTNIVKLTSLFIMLTTLNPIYRRLFRIAREIKALSIIKIIDGYGSLGLYYVLLTFGYGLYGIIYAALALRIIVILLMMIYIKPKIGFRWPTYSPLKQYLRFGIPLIPASLSYWLINLTDRYIISYYLDTSAVGIYSASYALGRFPYLVSGIINFIIMIAISKLYDEGKIDEVKAHLSYGLKYFLALSIPLLFGTIIISEQLLSALTTTLIAKQGKYITPIVTLGHIFLGIYTILTYILTVSKKTKVMAKVWFLSLPLNFILNIVVIPIYGILGAALTTLLSYLLALCIVCYFALKEFTFNPNWGFIFKSTIASIVMALAIVYFTPQGNFATMMTIIGGAGIYTIVIILLKGFTKKEFELFAGLIKRG